MAGTEATQRRSRCTRRHLQSRTPDVAQVVDNAVAATRMLQECLHAMACRADPGVRVKAVRDGEIVLLAIQGATFDEAWGRVRDIHETFRTGRCAAVEVLAATGSAS